MTRTSPMFVHVGLLGVVLIVLLIGGEATLGSWGMVPVRPLSLFLLAAIMTHGASNLLPRGQTAARAGAWGILAASTLVFEPLLRAPVVAPILVLGAVDIVVHRRGLDAGEGPAGARGQAIAGVTTVLMLVLVAVLTVISRDGLVLVRLAGTVFVAWFIVSAIALRPGLQSPVVLLGASGLVSVAFLFLAAPVLPYGPVLAYLVLVSSMALAVIASVSLGVQAAWGAGHVRHEQTVEVLPDPALSSLSARMERFVASGRGEEALSVRVEEALGVKEGGGLLGRAVRAQAGDQDPSVETREEALVRLVRGRGDAFGDGEVR